MTDATAAVTDTLLTDAWGREIVNTGSTVNPFEAFGQWGYYRDQASRLYVQARHLRVDLGRWMSRDPIGFAGGDWSIFRYVANSPLRFGDPRGLFGIRQYEPPTIDGSCGGVTFKIQWTFTPAESSATLTGYIIQEDHFAFDVHECGSGHNIPVDGYTPAIRDGGYFWEAWQYFGSQVWTSVYPGEKQAKKEHDVWSIPDQHDNTWGCIRIYAYAWRVPNYSMTVPPWVKYDPRWPTGDLVTIAPPKAPWDGPWPGMVKHSLKACWCCCKNPVRTHIVEIVPGP